MILENIQQFQKFDNPSQEFLRFAKDFFSNGKADEVHYPSFRSCLLRVPHSFNAKCITKDESFENSKVKIIQKWNGYRPSIVASEILYDFQTYLIQKKIDDYNYRQKIMMQKQQQRKRNNQHNNYPNAYYYYYKWIDQKILVHPFEDYRKIIVDLILAPYLINIKKLSYQESYQIIRKWLDKCDTLKELDRSCKFDSRIAYALKIASNKRIGPMSLYRIKTDSKYSNLYLLLLQK